MAKKDILRELELSIPKISPEEQKELTAVVKKATWLSSDEKKSALESLKKRHPVRNVRLDEYNIPESVAPQFVPPGGDGDARLYDAEKDEWKAFKFDEFSLYEILDTLTFALARGKLNSRTWVSQVFKSSSNWEAFLEELGAYETCYRIRDPWWWTLAKLGEHEDVEEGFSTAEEMAEALSEHAEETGQTPRLK